MSLSLSNPFANDRPETLEHTLDAGATCIAYNRGGKYTGALLASGRFDGFVNVWDMLTLAPLRVFEGHVKAVSTVSWSKNSRFLLSASRDWNCIVWDMETSERAATIKFDAPIQEAFFHPFTSKCILVTLSTQQTFLVDLTTSKHVKTEIGQLWEEDNEGNTIQRSQMTTARFSTDGQYIFGGTAQGRVIVFELPSLNVVSESGMCNGAIKQISISNSDRLLACTSRDRTVRVAQVSEDKDIQPVFRFVDEIDKTQWNAVCFSNDNEYIIGGSGHKATHYIYIWESTSGALMKVVEGPRDPLHDVIWHPSKPNMASIDSHGQILTWTTNNKQRWAAFAPGFEELEANIQYKEKEDEFDIYVDQDNKPVKEPLEEGVIDIDTIPEEFRVQEVVTPEFIETHFKDEEDTDINFFPSPPELSDVEDEE